MAVADRARFDREMAGYTPPPAAAGGDKVSSVRRCRRRRRSSSSWCGCLEAHSAGSVPDAGGGDEAAHPRRAATQQIRVHDFLVRDGGGTAARACAAPGPRVKRGVRMFVRVLMCCVGDGQPEEPAAYA